jgi:hypothetical protein
MRAYIRLYDELLQGFDPFAMVGRQYVDQCPACKSVGKWRQQDGEWYCSSSGCGASRPWNIAAVFKGYFQDGLARVSMRTERGTWKGGVQMKPTARVRYDTQADKIVDLGMVWVVLLWEEYVLLRLRVELESWAAAERWLRENWYWEKWHHHKIKRAVEEARDKAEARMVTMGLMDRGDLKT